MHTSREECVEEQGEVCFSEECEESTNVWGGKQQNQKDNMTQPFFCFLSSLCSSTAMTAAHHLQHVCKISTAAKKITDEKVGLSHWLSLSNYKTMSWYSTGNVPQWEDPGFDPSNSHISCKVSTGNLLVIQLRKFLKCSEENNNILKIFYLSLVVSSHPVCPGVEVSVISLPPSQYNAGKWIPFFLFLHFFTTNIPTEIQNLL